MIEPQDKELDNILKQIARLKETGLKAKLVVYIDYGKVQQFCDIIFKEDLGE